MRGIILTFISLAACLGSTKSASQNWSPPPAASAEEKEQFASLSIQVAPPLILGEDARHAQDLAEQVRTELISTLGQSGFRAGSSVGRLIVRLQFRVEYTFPDNTRLATEVAVEDEGTLILRDTLPLETLPTRILPNRLALVLDAGIRNASQIKTLARRAAEKAPAAERPPVRPPAAVVAVLGFTPGPGLAEDEASQLSDYLTARVTEILGWPAVPKNRLQESIRDAKKESYKECYDEACQIELGRAVAADKLLVPKLLKTGATCILSLSVYDLKTEASERAASVKSGCAMTEWIQAIDEACDRMLIR